MKKYIANIDFTGVSVTCLIFRLFCAGYSHAPVLFGTLGGLYAAIVAFKSANLIALFIRNTFNRQ